jgi:zinc protease
MRMSEDEGAVGVEYRDDTPLPLDEKCLHGTLSNCLIRHLTYYIQDNEKPEARAEVRLVVKIGSVYEEDDEQGLAH